MKLFRKIECNDTVASSSNRITKDDIVNFSSKLDFWQTIHLLMSVKFLDEPEISREEAYKFALQNSMDEEEVKFSLNQLINNESIFR